MNNGNRAYYAIMSVMLAIILYAIALLLEEVTYDNYHQSKKYTIEVFYLNGRNETLVFKLPPKIHLQINCHSSKGYFRNCNLEYVNTDLHLSQGSWRKVISGVNSFKLLKID